MSTARPSPQPLSRPHRALACLLACLVFALGLIGASPALHAHLHADAAAHSHKAPAPHDDAGCAVTLFQQGTTIPLALPTLSAPPAARILATLRAPEAPLPLAPSHRLHPARGPPTVL